MTGVSEAIARTNARHHRPVNWFLIGAHPSCSCGFGENNNVALIRHWADLGIGWYEYRGQLRWRVA